MSFSSLLNQTASFMPVSSVKTSMNRTSSILLTASMITVPCYITEISYNPINMGKQVMLYTHLLYTDYNASLLNDDYVVVINSKQYEIQEILGTFGNHHLEFGCTIIGE